jgi:tripartite-type tricarboxylate transporter receptor subunit TctC
MLLAPAGTPPDILARLHAEVRGVYESPEVRDTLNRAAIDPMLMNPGESARFLRAQYEKWGKLIKDVGFKPQ